MFCLCFAAVGDMSAVSSDLVVSAAVRQAVGLQAAHLLTAVSHR